MDNDDMDRVRNRIAALKLLNSVVNPVEEYRMEMNKLIQAKKRDIEGLTDRIMVLQDTDYDLFKYIMDLEQAHNSIWCPRCDMMKIVKPAEVNTDMYLEEIETLSRTASSLRSNITALEKEFQYRADSYLKKIDQLSGDLESIRKNVGKNSGDINKDQLIQPTQSTQSTQLQPTQLQPTQLQQKRSAVTGKLPQAQPRSQPHAPLTLKEPEKIDFNVDPLNTFSADDLLN